MNHIIDEEVLKAGCDKGIYNDTQQCEWTADEVEVLRNWYPIEGSNVAKRFDNKTRALCVAKAQELKLGYIEWRKEEDDIIRKYYPSEGSEVYKRLECRTQVSCIIRAKELGLKKI